MVLHVLDLNELSFFGHVVLIVIVVLFVTTAAAAVVVGAVVVCASPAAFLESLRDHRLCEMDSGLWFPALKLVCQQVDEICVSQQLSEIRRVVVGLPDELEAGLLRQEVELDCFCLGQRLDEVHGVMKWAGSFSGRRLGLYIYAF